MVEAARKLLVVAMVAVMVVAIIEERWGPARAAEHFTIDDAGRRDGLETACDARARPMC